MQFLQRGVAEFVLGVVFCVGDLARNPALSCIYVLKSRALPPSGSEEEPSLVSHDTVLFCFSGSVVAPSRAPAAALLPRVGRSSSLLACLSPVLAPGCVLSLSRKPLCQSQSAVFRRGSPQSLLLPPQPLIFALFCVAGAYFLQQAYPSRSLHTGSA